MMTRIKPVTSLTVLALFVLTLSCDASVASDRDRHAADGDIQTCITEVNKHADYIGALKVVHWIVDLEQRNPEELKIRVETSVYQDKLDDVAREYEASCVTGPLGKLVSFRISRTEQSG